MTYRLLMAALCLLGGVLGHTRSDEDLMQMSLDELLSINIVTASKVEQQANLAPVTVRTISKEQIERLGLRDLKDIFRTLPGFDISYDVQGEVRTLVIGRGILGNQKLKILLDGRNYSPETGERFIYGHNIPLSMVERIEVVYGSASALYGPDAFAGVINLITKKGGDINGLEVNLGRVDTDATTADVTFGKTLDNGLDVMLYFRSFKGDDYALHEDYADYAPVLAYQDSLGARGNDYPIDNWNFLGKLRWGKWSLGFDWQKFRETNAPSTIPTNYAYVEDNVWAQNLGHAYLSYETEVRDGLIWTTTLSTQEYEVDPESNFFIIQDTNLSSGLPSYKYAFSRTNIIETQVSWQSEKLSLVGGALYKDVKSFPKTQNLAVPFDSGGSLIDDLSQFVDGNGNTFGLLGLNEAAFGERNYDGHGIYLQAQFSPGSKWHATLGGRFDTTSLYGDTTNPRAGLVYEASDDLKMRASYSTAYIQPSNYYRWENWANPFAMHIPNVDIQPETVDSFSLGATLIKGNISLQVDLFRNDLQDVIRPVPAPGQADNYPYYNPLRTVIGASMDSGFVEINANLGEIETYGGELELTFKRGSMVTSLAYSHVDGDDNGFPIAKTSKHKFTANLNWNLKSWEIGGTARHYSSVNTAVFNSEFGVGGTNSLSFDGATVVYANLSRSFADRFRINLAADNLFDEKHYAASPYGESVWITSRAPQAGRKLWLNLKVKL